MRKHPLIALIAFTFSAVIIFISAAGASSIDAVAARATSHLNRRMVAPPVASGYNLRWFVTETRQRAAAQAQLAAAITAQRNSPAYQDRAADLVAVHDVARPARSMLPSAWRVAERAAVARAAEKAAAIAAAAAQQAQQAQEAQQQQQAQELLQQQQAQEAQAAQATRDEEAKAAKAALSAKRVQATRPSQVKTSRTTTVPPAPADLGGVWFSLRLCESGNNYGEDSGNGFYGAYQFALSTWWGLGYGGVPSDAPPAVQDQAAERLQAEAGWGQWPACSAELGL